jgi:ABC-type transport system substrate-binding protein
MQALKTGEVAMLDRIVPWEIEALAASGEIAVERYAVPTLHCLIPNLDQPLLTRPAFRRALLAGINREDVLRTQLLRGAAATLGQTVSGPFPRGQDLEDPVGYAYNEGVDPYPYNPFLAMVRVGMARQELALRELHNKSKSSDGRPATVDPDAKLAAIELPPLPKLVLAHPPHDIARVACRAIQKQLAAIHIPIELKELPPQSISARSGPWDLLYAELSMWEPVIDARRLLGPQGLAGSCSPYMELILRELERAEDWKRARETLLEVHRQTYQDVPIIPLWQLVDHFAYHKSLQGVGKRPAMLYQQIESWRSPPWFVVEAL